jgi:hypothetical protein
MTSMTQVLHLIGLSKIGKVVALPNDPAWADIWGNNVRFAVLFDNLSSSFSRKVNYSAKEINKAEEDVWIVYPWEK